MTKSEFIREVRLPYSRAQRDRFRSGVLGHQWMGRYPHLFDDDDIRIYENQCEGGYHFFEWLATVILYESTGRLTLMEKYNAIRHPRKRELFRNIVPKPVFDGLEEDCSGQPDLFVYTPALTEWSFCETKGPGDKLRDNQLRPFRRLYDLSGKPILVLQFDELDL